MFSFVSAAWTQLYWEVFWPAPKKTVHFMMVVGLEHVMVRFKWEGDQIFILEKKKLTKQAHHNVHLVTERQQKAPQQKHTCKHTKPQSVTGQWPSLYIQPSVLLIHLIVVTVCLLKGKTVDSD